MGYGYWLVVVRLEGSGGGGGNKLGWFEILSYIHCPIHIVTNLWPAVFVGEDVGLVKTSQMAISKITNCNCGKTPETCSTPGECKYSPGNKGL